MFCYYIYSDPRIDKLEPIYAGKGYPGRPYKHLNGSHNRHFNRKLSKIKKLGLFPEIIKKNSRSSKNHECFKTV